MLISLLFLIFFAGNSFSRGLSDSLVLLYARTVQDAILDLKNIDLPMKLMLSASREGEIKLWR